MAFERFTRDTDNIESLSDRPNQNEGLSATQLKRRFDQVGVDLAEFVNNHLNELESSEEGESGADSIGVTPIKDGGADTLQTVLGELKADQVGADSSAVHKTGDETIAGAKTFNAKAVFKAGLQYSTESKDSLGKGDDNMTVLSAVGGGKESYVVIVPETDSAGKDILFVSARNDAAMKKVWHSGNDGAGSGLDADKLDGAEGADFVKKAGSETITGDKTFTGDVVVQTPSGNTNPATKKYVDDKDALVVHLAGSETVTGDKIFSGAINVPPAASGAHAVNKTYLETNVYTKTNLQTSGSAQVHWGNLTNVPPLGDEHWKPVVANRAALPLDGNKLGDNRMVLDDGDGKQAVYTCIATTGDVDAQWAKIGDVDWVSEEQTRIDNENARIAAEGSGDPKSGRIGAEIDRVSAEEARALAEGGASPKSGRVGAELDREDAESARASAESNRETAEGSASPRSGRIGAELDRVDAENARAVFETYDDQKEYLKGNKVFYKGCSYICLKTAENKDPDTEDTYWLPIALQGDMPGHTWNGTKLQFENPDGSWGDAIDLEVQIYDGLDSTATDKALSARQGKELDNKIGAHLADALPHELTDLRDSTKYRFGLQISAEGVTQLVYEEVV